MYCKSVNIILFAFLIVINLSFNSSKRGYQPYTLIAKEGKYARDGMRQYLYVPVLLINNTNDTLKYIAWTCPLNKEYTVQCDVLTRDYNIVCDATFPTQLTIPPHQSKETEMKLIFKNSFRGGAVEYKMYFDLYDDPYKYMYWFLKRSSVEPKPKKLQSNVVQMIIVSR